MGVGEEGRGREKEEGGGEEERESQHTAACLHDVSRLPDPVSKSGQHLNPTGF